MAHETGHIAGGHIARSEDAMRKAEYEGLAAMALGIALAAATGGAGGAAMLGAAGVAENAWLQYSIEQEARADQAALTFLDRTHQSAKGLLQFFEILQQMEFLSGQKEVPYLRTHPLTEQRIDYVREHVNNSPYSNDPDTPENIHLLAMMKAKLAGFMQAPQDTLRQFPDSDTSEGGRYARAIAYYRIPDLAHALPEIQGLIHDYPNNPYYAELKGQMLFENGRVAEAVGPYRKASQLDPSSMLLRTELAQVEIEIREPHPAERGPHQPRGRDRPRSAKPGGVAPACHRLWAQQQHGHGVAGTCRTGRGARRQRQGAPRSAARGPSASGRPGTAARPRHCRRGETQRGQGLMFYRILPILLCLAVVAVTTARADPLTPDQKKQVEGIVHDYLVAHPEVLMDAIKAAADKDKVDKLAHTAETIRAHRHELYDDPDSQVGGNPKGDVDHRRVLRLPLPLLQADAAPDRGTAEDRPQPAHRL